MADFVCCGCGKIKDSTKESMKMTRQKVTDNSIVVTVDFTSIKSLFGGICDECMAEAFIEMAQHLSKMKP